MLSDYEKQLLQEVLLEVEASKQIYWDDPEKDRLQTLNRALVRENILKQSLSKGKYHLIVCS